MRRDTLNPGDHARHTSRGDGIVGNCSDYQYCDFTTADGVTHFVCKDNLSKIK